MVVLGLICDWSSLESGEEVLAELLVEGTFEGRFRVDSDSSSNAISSLSFFLRCDGRASDCGLLWDLDLFPAIRMTYGS